MRSRRPAHHTPLRLPQTMNVKLWFSSTRSLGVSWERVVISDEPRTQADPEHHSKRPGIRRVCANPHCLSLAVGQIGLGRQQKHHHAPQSSRDRQPPAAAAAAVGQPHLLEAVERRQGIGGSLLGDGRIVAGRAGRRGLAAGRVAAGLDAGLLLWRLRIAEARETLVVSGVGAAGDEAIGGRMGRRRICPQSERQPSGCYYR